MTRWFWLSLVLTVLTIGGTLYVYYAHHDKLPAQIPVHWNIHGQPDDWTPKEDALSALLVAPGIMAGMLVLTLILPWLSPRKFDVDRFRTTFQFIMALVVALACYLQTIILWAVFDQNLDVGRMMIGGILIFLALCSNVLGRVQRNFWMGIRTPWTLASETVWIQTHRLAAWLWTPGSLIGGLAVFLGAPLLWCFIGLMILIAVPVAYSLILYKRLDKQGRFDEASEHSTVSGETS